MVFQAFNLFPHLTVLENVTLAPRRAHRQERKATRGAARELLARFGLAGREGSYPDRLSGGQQQRVALARALAPNPRALLLDEVTSALDPELVGEVLEAVRELKAEGITMLITTHEMGFAREVADEVCFLHEGLIVERGEPERIFTAPEQPETQRFLRRLLDARRSRRARRARRAAAAHGSGREQLLQLCRCDRPRRAGRSRRASRRRSGSAGRSSSRSSRRAERVRRDHVPD